MKAMQPAEAPPPYNPVYEEIRLHGQVPASAPPAVPPPVYYSSGSRDVGLSGSAINGPQVIILTQSAIPAPAYRAPATTPTKQSFKCHMVISCFAFWLCWVVFGAFAFLFASMASKKLKQGDPRSAEKCGKLSMTLSILGILTGCAAWGVMIWWLVTYVIYCPWVINGYCYAYRICGVQSSSSCKAYTNSWAYLGGCCYFNYYD